VSRDIPFTLSSDSEMQPIEEAWNSFGGGGSGLEDEGTVIILAVTLAIVLVAITVVVVVFVCVRAAEQRHVPDITDISIRSRLPVLFVQEKHPHESSFSVPRSS